MKKILFGLLFLSACGSDDTTQLTKAQLGARWPFSVDEVAVGCAKGRTYVVGPGGRQYALNGSAGGARKPDGSKMYLDIADIWLVDPAGGPGAHMDLLPVMEAAEKHCSK